MIDQWPGQMGNDHDPTAFDIGFDPTTRRMRGIAVHGDTPFDVPFLSEIAPNLWQGGCEDGLILPEEIKYVVSLYPWERYTINHELNEPRLEVRMYDSADGEPDRDTIVTLAKQINIWRETGAAVSHCQAGLNRSSLITATALMLEGMGPQEAIDLIREKRSPACLCNPTFHRWVLEFRP
jgi:protein-tyrosine phosphatase